MSDLHLSRAQVFRAQGELKNEHWLAERDSGFEPLIGDFSVVKQSQKRDSDSLKNETQSLKNETQTVSKMRLDSLKNETESLKNETPVVSKMRLDSLKNETESLKNETRINRNNQTLNPEPLSREESQSVRVRVREDAPKVNSEGLSLGDFSRTLIEHRQRALQVNTLPKFAIEAEACKRMFQNGRTTQEALTQYKALTTAKWRQGPVTWDLVANTIDDAIRDKTIVRENGNGHDKHGPVETKSKPTLEELERRMANPIVELRKPEKRA